MVFFVHWNDMNIFLMSQTNYCQESKLVWVLNSIYVDWFDMCRLIWNWQTISFFNKNNSFFCDFRMFVLFVVQYLCCHQWVHDIFLHLICCDPKSKKKWNAFWYLFSPNYFLLIIFKNFVISSDKPLFSKVSKLQKFCLVLRSPILTIFLQFHFFLNYNSIFYSKYPKTYISICTSFIFLRIRNFQSLNFSIIEFH